MSNKNYPKIKKQKPFSRFSLNRTRENYPIITFALWRASANGNKKLIKLSHFLALFQLSTSLFPFLLQSSISPQVCQNYIFPHIELVCGVEDIFRTLLCPSWSTTHCLRCEIIPGPTKRDHLQWRFCLQMFFHGEWMSEQASTRDEWMNHYSTKVCCCLKYFSWIQKIKAFVCCVFEGMNEWRKWGDGWRKGKGKQTAKVIIWHKTMKKRLVKSI